MKKIITLLLSLIMILVFCSCESENVKNAKTAYAEGKYSEVVELLSQEENLNDSAKDMLTVSEANVLYENKKYVEAVKKLSESSKGVQAEPFEEWFKSALDDCIANKSSEGIIELLTVDESKSDAVYDAVTGACNNKDYNGFLVLDGLVDKLEDGDLKTKLAEFGDEYDILRAEAFLVGKWEWPREGEDKYSVVKVIPYEDNLVGRLTTVGTFLEDFHFKKDEVYWEKFSFENKKRCLCYNLTKYEDGTVAGETVTGTINYKKGTITLQLTDALETERTWKRK